MKSLYKIVVFDIDGTVANNEHRLHWLSSNPKNWNAFNIGIINDSVYEDIKFIYDILNTKDNIMIFCSGRNEETRLDTEKWLAKNGFVYVALYMRKAKDYRKDSIVKVELLNEIRKEYGEPYLWFDDRNQVVDAIRAEGVRVLQVRPGDF